MIFITGLLNKKGNEMSLNNSIINIRVELQNSKINKSGHNKFAGFTYFELADFLPKLNELMLKEGINDIFTIEDNQAILKLVKEKEMNTYKIPFIMFDVPLNKSGQPSMQQIQYLGALNTYNKRYLYLNAFGITDGEVIDAMPMPEEPQKPLPTVSKATDDDKKRVWNDFSTKCRSLEVDPMEFLEWAGVDMADKKTLHNIVVKYLKSENLFVEQLEIFKDVKN
jgi:hypothetical protein